MFRVSLGLFCAAAVAMSAILTAPTEATARPTKKTHVTKKTKKKMLVSRRSRCTPAARAEGKRQAIELVRTRSEELCRLAGIEPAVDSATITQVQNRIASDGELLADSQLTTQFDESEDLAELEAEDDVAVDIENFRTLWLQYVSDDQAENTDAGIAKSRIVDFIMDWLGTRYRFGGTERTGIDCSAFIRQLYVTAAHIELPRTASSQYNEVGVPIKDRSQLAFGDLVFFHTRRYARASHVGVYLGDNLFAHSSSRYGVTISSLESTYYGKRMIGARRPTADDLQRLALAPQPDENQNLDPN